MCDYNLFALLVKYQDKLKNPRFLKMFERLVYDQYGIYMEISQEKDCDGETYYEVYEREKMCLFGKPLSRKTVFYPNNERNDNE